MASVIREHHNGRTRYRVQWVDGNKRRKSIRLPGCNAKDADHIARKVQALVGCQISGRGWDADTAAWVRDIGDDLAGKLSEHNLIEKRQSATLGEFIDAYIVSRE